MNEIKEMSNEKALSKLRHPGIIWLCLVLGFVLLGGCNVLSVISFFGAGFGSTGELLWLPTKTRMGTILVGVEEAAVNNSVPGQGP